MNEPEQIYEPLFRAPKSKRSPFETFLVNKISNATSTAQTLNVSKANVPTKKHRIKLSKGKTLSVNYNPALQSINHSYEETLPQGEPGKRFQERFILHETKLALRAKQKPKRTQTANASPNTNYQTIEDVSPMPYMNQLIKFISRGGSAPQTMRLEELEQFPSPNLVHSQSVSPKKVVVESTGALRSSRDSKFVDASPTKSSGHHQRTLTESELHMKASSTHRRTTSLQQNLQRCAVPTLNTEVGEATPMPNAFFLREPSGFDVDKMLDPHINPEVLKSMSIYKHYKLSEEKNRRDISSSENDSFKSSAMKKRILSAQSSKFSPKRSHVRSASHNTFNEEMLKTSLTSPKGKFKTVKNRFDSPRFESSINQALAFSQTGSLSNNFAEQNVRPFF
jgi:hypothetical protein